MHLHLFTPHCTSVLALATKVTITIRNLPARHSLHHCYSGIHAKCCSQSSLSTAAIYEQQLSVTTRTSLSQALHFHAQYMQVIVQTVWQNCNVLQKVIDSPFYHVLHARLHTSLLGILVPLHGRGHAPALSLHLRLHPEVPARTCFRILRVLPAALSGQHCSTPGYFH